MWCLAQNGIQIDLNKCLGDNAGTFQNAMCSVVESCRRIRIMIIANVNNSGDHHHDHVASIHAKHAIQ